MEGETVTFQQKLITLYLGSTISPLRARPWRSWPLPWIGEKWLFHLPSQIHRQCSYNWEEANEVPHYWLNHPSSNSPDLESSAHGSDASLLGESPDRCVLPYCMRGTHLDTHASSVALAAQRVTLDHRWSH
jgi:hypothetical protein